MSDKVRAADLSNDPLTRAVGGLILRMEPGERLPSERELAERLEISRTALRDRLSRFESLGVLERRTGAGTFVRELQPGTVSETLILGLAGAGMTLSSLTSVRLALEREAAREAALIAVDHLKVAHMAAAVQQMESSDDPEQMLAADLAFHRALFIASGSQALVFFADALSGVLSRSVQQRISRLIRDRRSIRSLHRAIYKAVADRDPVEAMRAVDEHFAAWFDDKDAKPR